VLSALVVHFSCLALRVVANYDPFWTLPIIGLVVNTTQWLLLIVRVDTTYCIVHSMDGWSWYWLSHLISTVRFFFFVLARWTTACCLFANCSSSWQCMEPNHDGGYGGWGLEVGVECCGL